MSMTDSVLEYEFATYASWPQTAVGFPFIVERDITPSCAFAGANISA